MATPHELLEEHPELISPAHLMVADSHGKLKTPRHILHANKMLLDFAYGKYERLLMNWPFQHGKTLLCSKYFLAWYLMMWPEKRCLLSAHEERYAEAIGSAVKDIVTRWARHTGISLKDDTQAKGEWVIEGHEGGLVCRGMKGSLQGRPADCFVVEDPLKDAAQALSMVTLDAQWEWYQTVAYSRLGPDAKIVMVTTRWVPKDLCGRVLDEMKEGGEHWEVVKFKAIAEENDILGRKPGEALWPERVPLKRLQMIQQKRGKWFRAAWQQEPEDEEGSYFNPRKWPRFFDRGNLYEVPGLQGAPRLFVPKEDCFLFTTLDWAYSEKKTADRSAILTFAVLPDRRALLIEVIAERLGIHMLAPTLANVCRRLRPRLCAVEVGHPTLSQECLRYPEIPEIRWIKPLNQTKLIRAFAAIQAGHNGHFLLPHSTQPTDWLEPFLTRLTRVRFSGGEEEDDEADALGTAGDLLRNLAHSTLATRHEENLPDYGGPLVPGRPIIDRSDRDWDYSPNRGNTGQGWGGW